MNAMIFAAGLGTRLRPLTDHKPKALVSVGGRPMIDHVVDKLRRSGFDHIVVNAHHEKEQMVDYLRGTDIRVSVEEELLDTGGGLKRALPLFDDDSPILVHNVDIFSNVDLKAVYEAFDSQELALLVVSERDTARQLLFDDEMRLVGWRHKETGEVRSPYEGLNTEKCRKYAFAGIHCVSRQIERYMAGWPERFSIIDFYLHHAREVKVRGITFPNIQVIDIGKIETLKQVETLETI